MSQVREQIGKLLRRSAPISKEVPPRRWVDLINHLNEREWKERQSKPAQDDLRAR